MSTVRAASHLMPLNPQSQPTALVSKILPQKTAPSFAKLLISPPCHFHGTKSAIARLLFPRIGRASRGSKRRSRPFGMSSLRFSVSRAAPSPLSRNRSGSFPATTATNLGKAEAQAFSYIQGLVNEGRTEEVPRYVIVSDFNRIVLPARFSGLRSISLERRTTDNISDVLPIGVEMSGDP
jgi:hypothetical protein